MARWVRRTSAARAQAAQVGGKVRGQRTEDPTGLKTPIRKYELAYEKAIRDGMKKTIKRVLASGGIAATTDNESSPAIHGILTFDQFALGLSADIRGIIEDGRLADEVNITFALEKATNDADQAVKRAQALDPNIPSVFTQFDMFLPQSVVDAFVDNPGRYFKEEITVRFQAQILDAVREAALAGEGPQGIAKKIQEITNGEMWKARRIARTEMVRAYTGGTIRRYGQHDVPRVMWIAALGERCCDTCEMLHGNIFPIANLPEEPPLHPNCRCSLAPVWSGRADKHLVEIIGY